MFLSVTVLYRVSQKKWCVSLLLQQANAPFFLGYPVIYLSSCLSNSLTLVISMYVQSLSKIERNWVQGKREDTVQCAEYVAADR